MSKELLPGERLLASAEGVSLVEREDDAWLLRTGDSETEYDDCGEALRDMNRLLAKKSRKVTVEYHVDIDELTDYADEDEGLFPSAADGWSHTDIGWMPVGTADDPAGAATLVHEAGKHGVAVYLHHWNDRFGIYCSGFEGEDSDWRYCDATDLTAAIAETEDALSDLLDLQGLNFPPFMGLDNLTNVYEVPAKAIAVQRRTSFWTYGEEYVCELTVYRHETSDGVRYLVADDETDKVIGEYESLEAIDDAETLDEYEKLEYETEDIEDDDE